MNKQLKSTALLFLTAFIWGTAFVAQKSGMDTIGPLAFNGIRTIIGGMVLVPFILLWGRKSKKDSPQIPVLPEESDNRNKSSAHDIPEEFGNRNKSFTHEIQDKTDTRRTLILGGILCGIALGVASTIQQIGIFYTTVSHSGFITALYVVIVPIFSILLGKRVRPIIWGCIIASATGLYLLCIPSEGFGEICIGDIIIIVSALCFAAHIMIIDHFSPKVDGVKMSCIQFFVAGILVLIAMPIIDPALGFNLPDLASLQGAATSILYAGVMSSGVAYTLQIVAQKDADPTIASMILCLESVFALIAGMLILHEMMTTRELIGCAIMFIAIVIAELPERDKC